MSITNVKNFFHQYDMENRIQEFNVSSATVELAAQALNCEPAHIAKTMSFLVDNHAILVVLAGDVKVDNSKFKFQFHTKAKMLTPDQLDELVGHSIGGVCPFAIKDGVSVYLDESLKRFEKVYPACGSSNSAIGLTIEELEKYSGYTQWINISKAPIIS